MSDELDSLIARLRTDDGYSTPTLGDLLEAADALVDLRARLQAAEKMLAQQPFDVAKFELPPATCAATAASVTTNQTNTNAPPNITPPSLVATLRREHERARN